MATLSESLISDQDLRKQSVEFKRDKTHRARWAFGKRVHALHASPEHDGEKMKPIKAREITVPRRRRNLHMHPTAPVMQRAQERDIIAEAAYEKSPTNDEPVGPPQPTSPGQVSDGEIAYSYDAARGPGRGSQILGMALAQAVEKFEIRETERLVREEYEVIDGDGNPHGLSKKPKSSKTKGRETVSKPAPDSLEDDFELV